MKKIKIITFGLFFFIFVMLIFLFKPYESFHEVRNNTGPITITAKFENVTGDPGCAKLYTGNTRNGSSDLQPVFPALPDGMPAPDDGPYAYQNNVFELTGFTYDWVFLNKITGLEQRERSGRFDVIKWKLFQPYTVWVKTGADNEGRATEKRYAPIMYDYKSSDYSPANFTLGNYVDCLANE